MEEEMKRAIQTLKRQYAYYWLLAILLFVFGESGVCAYTGIYADSPRAIYAAESIVILFTAACIPCALKLFAYKLRQTILPCADTVTALHKYVFWSTVRIVMLAVPAVCGILCYHAMQSTTGLLCACISLLASLLCIPGMTRLHHDLNMQD